MRRRSTAALVAAAVVVAAGAGLLGSPAERAPGASRAGGTVRAPAQLPAATGARGRRWVAAWAAAPQPATLRTPAAALGLSDETVRNIVFPTVGGWAVRVRLTNAYGTQPLHVGAAAVAADPGGGPAPPGRPIQLSFGGRRAVTIPAGGAATSDPARVTVRPLQDVAVSVFVHGFSGSVTTHTVAEQVTYIARGDATLDGENATPARGAGRFSPAAHSWMFLSGVSVLAPPRTPGVVVAFGDSITDGVHSGVGANARYPDDLARRLAALPGARLSVVDEGIAGNRVLTSSRCYGASAVDRFRRDVLAQPAVRDVILLEGTNDIGMSRSLSACSLPHRPVSAAQIIAGDERIVDEAHDAGVRIFGGTLPPFRGARYWTQGGEAEREAVNRWIRRGGAFDGVIDFAAALADPHDPQVLAARFDSGDHLHPNAAGYQAMAAAVNLSMLMARRAG